MTRTPATSCRVVLPDFVYPVVKLITNNSTGDWCLLPYPGHPKGCPNYNKVDRCPPRAPKIKDYFDLSQPLYLVHSEFDLACHQSKMKESHPEWSDRQCRCVLYWQSSSRKQLKERISAASSLLNLDNIAMVPEAMGVNVYATARLSGLNLERIKGLQTCRHVALVGHGYGESQRSLF